MIHSFRANKFSIKHSIMDLIRGGGIPSEIEEEVAQAVSHSQPESTLTKVLGEGKPDNWRDYFFSNLVDFYSGGHNTLSDKEIKEVYKYSDSIIRSLKRAGVDLGEYSEIISEEDYSSYKKTVTTLYDLISFSNGTGLLDDKNLSDQIHNLNSFLLYLKDFDTLVNLNNDIAKGKLPEHEIEKLIQMVGASALGVITVANVTNKTRFMYNGHLSLAEKHYEGYTTKVHTPASFGFYYDDGVYKVYNEKLNHEITLNGKKYYLFASLLNKDNHIGDDYLTTYSLLTEEGKDVYLPVNSFNRDIKESLYEGAEYEDYSSKTKEIMGDDKVVSPTFFIFPSILYLTKELVNCSTASIVKNVTETKQEGTKGRAYSGISESTLDDKVTFHFFTADHSEVILSNPVNHTNELSGILSTCNIPYLLEEHYKGTQLSEEVKQEAKKALETLDRITKVYEQEEKESMKTVSEDFRARD